MPALCRSPWPRPDLLQALLDAPQRVAGHIDEAHGVAKPRLGIEGLAVHPDPSLVGKVDFKLDGDAGPLFIQGVDEAAALAEIVNLDGRVQHSQAPSVERPSYPVVPSAFGASVHNTARLVSGGAARRRRDVTRLLTAATVDEERIIASFVHGQRCAAARAAGPCGWNLGGWSFVHDTVGPPSR